MINFSLLKCLNTMSLDELQISFPKMHLMTSYPETLTVKIDEDEVFHYNYNIKYPKNETNLYSRQIRKIVVILFSSEINFD